MMRFAFALSLFTLLALQVTALPLEQAEAAEKRSSALTGVDSLGAGVGVTVGTSSGTQCSSWQMDECNSKVWSMDSSYNCAPYSNSGSYDGISICVDLWLVSICEAKGLGIDSNCQCTSYGTSGSGGQSASSVVPNHYTSTGKSSTISTTTQSITTTQSTKPSVSPKIYSASTTTQAKPSTTWSVIPMTKTSQTAKITSSSTTWAKSSITPYTKPSSTTPKSSTSPTAPKASTSTTKVSTPSSWTHQTVITTVVVTKTAYITPSQSYKSATSSSMQYSGSGSRGSYGCGGAFCMGWIDEFCVCQSWAK